MGLTSILVASLLAGIHPRAHAQAVPTARAVQVSTSPTIDGRLDDVMWAEIPGVTGFTQREPSEGRPVSQRTEVRLAIARAVGEHKQIVEALAARDPERAQAAMHQHMYSSEAALRQFVAEWQPVNPEIDTK